MQRSVSESSQDDRQIAGETSKADVDTDIHSGFEDVSLLNALLQGRVGHAH
jgi:hypothetical protein